MITFVTDYDEGIKLKMLKTIKAYDLRMALSTQKCFLSHYIGITKN